MRRPILSAASLLAAASLATSACSGNQTTDAPTPITNAPAARQTANSGSARPADAFVQLSPTQGNSATGQLQLTIEGDGVRVLGTLTSLAPNSTHAIHIHETGDCSAPDASSAGEHFDPLDQPHGAPGSSTHVGDLGNITANPAGVAYVDVWTPQATLHDAAATDIGSRAVVVHANADDLTSQPSGDSGARIACGVISKSKLPGH